MTTYREGYDGAQFGPLLRVKYSSEQALLAVFP
jgi:hypothetical protein